MKRILLILILICLSKSIFSQWGAKTGADFGTITGTDFAKYRVGFHAGATYDLAISNNLYFQPAILLSLHSIGLGYEEDGYVDKYSLEIPAVISFRPRLSNNMKMAFDFGLYAKYGLFGDAEYNTLEKRIKESSYNIYNRFDAGINIGVGVEISKLQIGISTQLGFTKANKQLNSQNNLIFRGSVGYKF